ncbi:MAG: transcription antitermination factor NusB [Lachnospiraceae bacterium]|nr:transcription antitermination factor NusB [Lachnospiraceae bacterium]
MSRRELREQIFKLLFRVEFNAPEDMPEQVRLFFEQDDPIDEQSQDEITQKYEKIVENLPKIDEMLDQTATGWTKDRMAKVELTILRLAVYEIRMDETIPVSVAINEAVELAKKFGQDESSSFVNGVLAKFAK